MINFPGHIQKDLEIDCSLLFFHTTYRTRFNVAIKEANRNISLTLASKTEEFSMTAKTSHKIER